jgi:hypothetical protein
MNIKSGILGGVIIIAMISSGYVVYDLLFSPPDHIEGIIIEKVFVKAKYTSGATPYGGVKRSKYFVTHQKDAQWVAIVKTTNGDTVKVHCEPDHYKTKNIGDVIHFKKYEGHLVHIDYFAHNEEEGN